MAALNTLHLGVVPSLVKYTLIRVAYSPLTRKTTLHAIDLTKEDLGINTLQRWWLGANDQVVTTSDETVKNFQGNSAHIEF